MNRRGRVGNKILLAFLKMPTEPVPFEEYRRQSGISADVLRQAKRFDKTGLVGQVRLKTINGIQHIYREPLSVGLAAITKAEDILP